MESTGSCDLGGDQGLQVHGALQYAHQASVGQTLIGSFNAWQAGAKLDIGSEQQKLTPADTDTGAGADLQTPWEGTPSYNNVIVRDVAIAGLLGYPPARMLDCRTRPRSLRAAGAHWLRPTP
jgi:hypothetical protein